MARLLAPAGARLVLTARSEAALEALADECRASGAEAHVVPHDLARPGAAQGLFDAVAALGLRIDVLVNNAGYGKLGQFDEYDAGVYEDMITLNVTNLVALTRLALPAMRASRDAGVLNVASTASFQPVPLMAVYGATKAFVRSFSEALHAELRGSGVRVSCLAPGPTSTPFMERANQARVPGGRPAMTAREVAQDGLEALAGNNRLRVAGLLNRVAAFGTRLAPTAVTLAAARKVMEMAE
jgi:uncharacterized protein